MADFDNSIKSKGDNKKYPNERDSKITKISDGSSLNILFSM